MSPVHHAMRKPRFTNWSFIFAVALAAVGVSAYRSVHVYEVSLTIGRTSHSLTQVEFDFVTLGVVFVALVVLAILAVKVPGGRIGGASLVWERLTLGQRFARKTASAWLPAVIVITIALGVLAQRRARFDRLAHEHRMLAVNYSRAVIRPPSDGPGESRVTDPWHYVWTQWHDTVAKKYERAASRPWLLLEPDPPASQ